MQYMQGIVHVGANTYMFGDMAFTHTRRGQETGKLSPQAAASVQGIEVRNIEAAHQRQSVGSLGLLALYVLPIPLGEGVHHVHKSVSFEGKPSQPLGILPEYLFGLVLFALVVEFAHLGVHRL